MTGLAPLPEVDKAIRAYETACRLVAEAKSVDEVLYARCKADAVRYTARVLQDRELEIDASELRIRSERRIGELLLHAREAGQIRDGRPSRADRAETPPSRQGSAATRITLRSIGVNERLAQTARGYAELPRQAFDDALIRRRAGILGSSQRVGVGLFDGAHAQARKAAERARREEELGARQNSLPDKRYGVILGDPEWDFVPRSTVTGMDRAAANHYPTSPTALIEARDVASIAAPDCALFLWATVPMLPDALGVMAAWGFCYVTGWVWAKDRIGTGYWNRNKHEHLLLGTRGAPPAPAPGTQFDSLLLAPRGAHSAKPEVFLEMIEAYYPTLPKIEMNRRGPPRPGWDAWGNEAVPGAVAA